MKRFAKFALIAALVALALSVTSCNRGGSSSYNVGRAAPASDFAYSLTGDGKGVVINRYTGKGGTVVIPAEIEGFPVVELAGKYYFSEYSNRHVINSDFSSAFYGETDSKYGPGRNITSVVIPASVKKIGDSCFYWIEKLGSVTIYGTDVEIGNKAFAKCINLKRLTFHGTGVFLKGEAFEGCLNLDTLIIPNGDNALIPAPGVVADFVSASMRPFMSDYSYTTAFLGCKKLPLAIRARLVAMGFDDP